MEKFIKFNGLTKEELFNELKNHIPTNGCLEFQNPTKDSCKLICNEDQLQLFIESNRNEFWFADAIGYRVTEENELEFMWDKDTQERIDADKQEFYRRKADFIGKYGSN